MEWFSYVIAIGIGLSAVISPWLVNDYFCSLNTLYIYFSNIPDSIENVLDHNQVIDTDELTNIVRVLSQQISKE